MISEGIRHKLGEFSEAEKELRKILPHYASTPRIMAVLRLFACELLALHELKNRSQSRDQIFDSWWNEIHDDTKRRLVERLKNACQESGLKCAIASEAESSTGSFDVLVEM